MASSNSSLDQRPFSELLRNSAIKINISALQVGATGTTFIIVGLDSLHNP